MQNRHGVSYFLIGALVFILAVAAGTGAYYEWGKKGADGTVTQDGAKVPDVNPQSPYANVVGYDNATYKYSLVLDADTWEGFKAIDNGAGTTFYLPTGDASYVGNAPTSIKEIDGKNYVSVFNVTAYSVNDWNAYIAEDQPTPQVMGRNGAYVFTYALAQDVPEDLMFAHSLKQVDKVADSFKAEGVWKRYADGDHEISLDYPADWNLDSALAKKAGRLAVFNSAASQASLDSGKAIEFMPDVSLTYYASVKDLPDGAGKPNNVETVTSLAKYLQLYSGGANDPVATYKAQRVGRYNGYAVTVPSMGDGASYYLEEEGHVYVFEYSASSKVTLDAMLATLMVRPPADITANWKTYTNAAYGYSFKYPSDWTVSEFPDTKSGAYFMPAGSTDAAITVDFTERPAASASLSYDEYVKQVPNIEGYVGLNDVRKIVTDTGALEYQITWKVMPHGGGTLISSPSTYYELSDKKGVVGLTSNFEADAYSTIYQAMAESYKVK